ICPRRCSASAPAAASRRCSSSISDPIRRLLTLLPETVRDSRHQQQPNHQLCRSDNPSKGAAPYEDATAEVLLRRTRREKRPQVRPEHLPLLCAATRDGSPPG